MSLCALYKTQEKVEIRKNKTIKHFYIITKKAPIKEHFLIDKTQAYLLKYIFLLEYNS